MQVKVVNGRVELRKDNGILVRVVGYSNAIYAELNSSKDVVLIITETGRLELRCLEGKMMKEVLPAGAKSAKFKNDKIIVNTANGNILEHPIF